MFILKKGMGHNSILDFKSNDCATYGNYFELNNIPFIQTHEKIKPLISTEKQRKPEYPQNLGFLI